jgi:hypothetical protein
MRLNLRVGRLAVTFLAERDFKAANNCRMFYNTGRIGIQVLE